MNRRHFENGADLKTVGDGPWSEVIPPRPDEDEHGAPGWDSCRTPGRPPDRSGPDDPSTRRVAFASVAYTVKEIYPTLQGEGANTGRAAVLCRFAGCNLCSGREKDRAAATCTFCDTRFLGTDGPNGGRFATAAELADTVARGLGRGHRR